MMLTSSSGTNYAFNEHENMLTDMAYLQYHLR